LSFHTGTAASDSHNNISESSVGGGKEHQIFSTIGYFKGETVTIKKLEKNDIIIDRATQLELKAVCSPICLFELSALSFFVCKMTYRISRVYFVLFI
jgi:hypothetical protein